MAAFNLVESLRVFRKVVDLGSFTGAARELRLSVPWTARHVARLESHLGVTLLQRSTRRLAITDAGRRCYEAAGRIGEEIDELEADLGDDATTAHGRVRLSAPMSYGICELGPLLAQFREHHPAIELEVVLNDRFVDLVDEGFDLAIRITATLPDSQLLVRQLGTIPSIACAAPAYLKKHGTPQRPEQLRAHSCLVFSPSALKNSWRFTREGKDVMVQPTAGIVCNNSLLLRTSLLAGAGVTVIPEFIVREDLEQGRVRKLLADFEPEVFHLFMLRPQDRRQPRRAKLLADFLAERLSSRPAGTTKRRSRTAQR